VTSSSAPLVLNINNCALIVHSVDAHMSHCKIERQREGPVNMVRLPMRRPAGTGAPL